MPAPTEFLTYIDAKADVFIKRLADAVAIPSISGDAKHRKDVFAMADWLNAQLKQLGVDTQLVDLGRHKMDGEDLPLPPAILGRIGSDSSKKTVLIYGHFDVQPANKSDGWDTDPFTLVVDEKTGRLIGRGSSDDKGPILGWLNVLQYHHENKLPLPVNLVFCFEGMEESGSEGLDDLVRRESKKGGYFDGVDCVCISDNYWLNTRTPALTYGLRGLSYYKVTISGPARDLHSGVFGRTGDILIKGVDEMVPRADEEEKAIYAGLDYSIADVEESAGASIALSADKVSVLMGRMREPSLSIHGIEGAFSGAGAKTVIPAKVSGKFSIRLVPPQTPEAIDPLAVYKQDPDLTREGGSIPVTLTFAESLGVNVLLLPMGRGDDGAHSTNEKLDRSNFIEGSKLLGTYLYELADIAKT
ncbi:hypothetical protein NLJ89_g8755 [Agrocybe chaxingu]|uniref:Peptidase M20 dimerisation domain-containing protein n=1 Tax=Agrocybe chaxingu TaxID=84603 RepID=A0A9W8MTS7_9AGAR|nr:hypothetical protein NLJ89_g8755 [Agrocybe chaxingu]